MVAVSILLDRHGLLPICSAYTHGVAADSNARTSSVSRSSPCEDGITELAFDSESRWIRTANDSNGSQSSLNSTVGSSSDSEADSGSSNTERDLVLNSILLDVLADGFETLAVVSLDGVGYTIALNRVPAESDRIAVLLGIESTDRTGSLRKRNSSLVSIKNRVSRIALAVTGSDLNLNEVACSNVVLSELLSGETARELALESINVLVELRTGVNAAAGKRNPRVLLSEAIDGNVSHLNFVCVNHSANRSGFGPAETDIALVDVDSSERRSRDSDDDNWYYGDVRSNGTASIS